MDTSNGDAGRPGGTGIPDRFVAALCEVPLAAWRAAALETARHPAGRRAATALEHALASIDRLRLWSLRDDLETALHRLTTDEACDVVRGRGECDCIRHVTRRALEALVCADRLCVAHLAALAGPLLGLVPPEEAAGDPVAPRARPYLRRGPRFRTPSRK